MADAPKLLGTDTLRQAYPKLNTMVDMVNYFQAQLDQMTVEGDSSVEAAQARVAADGTTYTTLQERLNNSDLHLKEISVNVKQPPFNLKGDGTDETQAFLNALTYAADNHYTLFIPKGVVISIDSVTLTSKTNFAIRIEGTIKRLNGSATVGALINLKECKDVHIPVIQFDGNGPNNGALEANVYTAAQEQKHTLKLDGCENIKMDYFHVKDPCGDGIYITGQTKNFTANEVIGYAATQIGRNLVSIISGENIHIGYLQSDNIGHYQMPGGFDIEPNASTEVVRNVFVDKMNISSGGTNVCSVLATNGSTVENVYLGEVNLIRTNKVAPTSEIHSARLSGSKININTLTVINKTVHPINGITLNNHGVTPKGINIKKSYVEGCYRGIQIGSGTAPIEDVEINMVADNLQLDGVNINTVKNLKLNIDIREIGSGRYKISKLAGTGVAENVKIQGRIAKQVNGAKALSIVSAEADIINWELNSLDFKGWADIDKVTGTGAASDIRKIDCPGLTFVTAKPSWGQWKVGDIVVNTAPTEIGTAGSRYIIDKWIAIYKGSGEAIWRESRVVTGT